MRQERAARRRRQERRRRIQARIRNTELRRIEQVEYLGPELDVCRLGDIRLLQHGEVVLRDTVAAEIGIGAALVAEGIGAWNREAPGVEPAA